MKNIYILFSYTSKNLYNYYSQNRKIKIANPIFYFCIQFKNLNYLANVYALLKILAFLCLY